MKSTRSDGADLGEPGKKKAKGRFPLWLHLLLGAVILGGLLLAFHKYVDGKEVLFRITHLPPLNAIGMLLLSAAYLWLGALWFGLALRPLSAVPFGTVMRAFSAGQPATLVPGGVAVRVGLLAEAGVPASKVSAAVILASALDMMSFMLLLLLSVLWFESARLPALLLLGSVAFCGLLLVIPAVRHFAYRLGAALFKRFKHEDAWERFSNSFGLMATPLILGGGLGINIVTKLLLIALLDLCLRGMGISLSFPVLMLATVLPTMIGRVLPLPGGIGPTEVGMVAILQNTGGMDLNTATAAVSIYRLATIVFQALLGAMIYFFFWKGEKEGLDLQEEMDAPLPGRSRKTAGEGGR